MYKRIIAFIVVLCLLPVGAFAKTQATITTNTRVYKSATTHSASAKIKKGTTVYLLFKDTTWSKIENPKNHATGYVKTKYLKIKTTSTTTKADKLITYAKKFIGRPYRKNASGPKAFDCSHFVSYCFRHVKISLSGSLKKLKNSANCIKIYTIGECKPGDILFFTADNNTEIEHVAIYMGNNQIIHASATAKKVLISRITDYYRRNFKYALRHKSL